MSRRRESGLSAVIGLGLFGLALALGWTVFSLTRIGPAVAKAESPAPAPAEIRPATITYREPASGGGLVTLSLAVQHARLFVAQPELALEGSLEQGSYGPGSYAIFYLETPGGEQSYKVDARTGEVLEMTRLDVLDDPVALTPLEQVQAEALAERFVADRFLGFKTLSLVDRSAMAGAGDTELYSFKWAVVAAESGAELPTTVSVSVSAASGEVIWYLAQREATTVDVRPKVGRDEAIATAVLLAERAERWAVETPSSVRLQVIFDPDNRQQLVWAVTFPSKPGESPEGRPGLRILVDAQTGQPVSNPA